MKTACVKFLMLLFPVLFLGPWRPLRAEPAATLPMVFKSHCVKCHGQDGNLEGELNLLALKTEHDVRADPRLLERLISVLVDGEMPPEGEPPLPEATRQHVTKRLRAMLREVLQQQAFQRTPMRRMNRFQYNNAVVDLLELERDVFQLNERLMRRRSDYFQPASGEMPTEVRVSCRPLSKDIDNQRPEGFRGVAAFPQDQRAEHGFDNRGDHLTLSPLLMESFLQLSQSIVESPDLRASECRSWDRLFAPPSPSAENPLDDGLETEQLPTTSPSTHRAAIVNRLEHLLRRAFRRPVDPQTLDRFTRFATAQLDANASFEDAMRTVVGAVLGMPDFLYFYETVDGEAAGADTSKHQRLDDFELASRLAQFFWSSIPDDTLLDLVEAGELSDSETLSAQIDRMMNDRRSSRFCDNFPSQWLQLDRLVTSIPDPQKFSYFYYNGYRTSMHMMSEPLLLFETVYVEDRSIMELVDPPFTWQSDMLRANYEGHAEGGRQVQVQVFQRVPLDDPRRGGVITNAAVMTMTSTPSRTQPITRGAWVNAVIFNDPPEPPPADVPPLPEANAEELAKLTIRERLALHRQRADCAGCHEKIDPLGFALENYGPTGVWRDRYENGREVDVRGTLFHRHQFDSVVEFKRLIVEQKHRFIRGFIAHLLSYALGRDLGPADSPALDDMTAKAVAGEDQLRTVLKTVAMSAPFLHKNTQAPP